MDKDVVIVVVLELDVAEVAEVEKVAVDELVVEVVVVVEDVALVVIKFTSVWVSASKLIVVIFVNVES